MLDAGSEHCYSDLFKSDSPGTPPSKDDSVGT
jgi:hypothetical protein